jgi:hypothetical protein
MIKVVRSWPVKVPDNHAYIHDDFERVMVDDYNYIELVKLGRDVIHLDWDVAVSPEDLDMFALYANDDRARVNVVPMYLYPGSPNGATFRSGNRPIWNVYQKLDHAPWQRECEPRDAYCSVFGFGMVYLPYRWLRAWHQETKENVLTDQSFSEWYNDKNGMTPIFWNIHPVHINYPAVKEI